MQYKKRLPELTIIHFFTTITAQNTLIKGTSGGIQLGIQASFTFNTPSYKWWRFTSMVFNRVPAAPYDTIYNTKESSEKIRFIKSL